MRVLGTVTSFNPGRGFGFIMPDSARTAVFAHVNEVRGKLYLRAGDRVEFAIGNSDKGKGKRAIDVQLLEDTAANGGAL